MTSPKISRVVAVHRELRREASGPPPGGEHGLGTAISQLLGYWICVLQSRSGWVRGLARGR